MLSPEAASVAADAALALLDRGPGPACIRLYSGGVPRSCAAAVPDSALVAEFRLGRPAFRPAVGGQAVANALDNDPHARGGRPSFFRALDGEGTVIFQDRAGGPRSGAAMTFSVDDVPRGESIGLSTFSFQLPLTED